MGNLGEIFPRYYHDVMGVLPNNISVSRISKWLLQCRNYYVCVHFVSKMEQENILSRFSNTSEAEASEVLEKLEGMCFRYS